ncbi:MAG: rod shape-determining protein MreC [Lentisphaerota bacterium]
MRDRNFILYVVLGAILLVVLNLPDHVSLEVKSALRDGMAPLQSAITGFFRDVKEVFRSVRGLGGLAVEKKKMVSELARLNREVNLLKTLEQENAALREQLGFRSKATQKLIACEVITRDISGWWQSVRLNKGAAEGVLPNMAVITMDGLVGKTVAVSARTADVLLISDPSCRISARVSRTGAFGVLIGGGSSDRGQVACQMQFINKTVPLQPGDEVVTSGLGGIFPKGLLIGYADKITRDKADLYQMAEVIPRADLGMMDYVFVVADQGDVLSDYLQKKDMTGAVEE